jgi:hypothetical protein
MLKRVAIVICAVAVSASAYAQEPKPAAAAQKPATADQPKPAAEKSQALTFKATEPPALPVNIKIEMSITDQSGANPPAKKTVSMIVGDRMRNSIRSSASVRVPNTVFGPAKPGDPPGPMVSYNYRNVTINVDAKATIVQKEPNKVMLEFVIQYAPKSGGGQEDLEPGMASLNESMTVILESGKPMTVSQAADPTSDRKITVEVTASILK